VQNLNFKDLTETKNEKSSNDTARMQEDNPFEDSDDSIKHVQVDRERNPQQELQESIFQEVFTTIINELKLEYSQTQSKAGVQVAEDSDLDRNESSDEREEAS